MSEPEAAAPPLEEADVSPREYRAWQAWRRVMVDEPAFQRWEHRQWGMEKADDGHWVEYDAPSTEEHDGSDREGDGMSDYTSDPAYIDRLMRGRDLTEAEARSYLADHQTPRHGTAGSALEVADRFRTLLDECRLARSEAPAEQAAAPPLDES